MFGHESMVNKIVKGCKVTIKISLKSVFCIRCIEHSTIEVLQGFKSKWVSKDKSLLYFCMQLIQKKGDMLQ